MTSAIQGLPRCSPASAEPKHLKVSLRTKLHISPNLLVATIDDESLLLDMDQNVYFGLNAVALEIWNGLENQESLERILERLMSEYDASQEALERDLLESVDLLTHHGLAHVSETPTHG